MLVTNPAARAQLTEVLSHPWMQRRFSGLPESHLMRREPLRAAELDKQVIRGMKGLGFGSEDDIERKLIQVLESDSYIRAVQAWERKRDKCQNDHPPRAGAESISSPLWAISFNRIRKAVSPISRPVKQKWGRYSAFDFYRRKLFSLTSYPLSSLLPTNSPFKSRSRLNILSIGDVNREPVDPTHGFHPLLSTYHLAREKLEREGTSRQFPTLHPGQCSSL
jgi:hypothetical protein